MSVFSATRVLVAAGLMFTAACGGGDGPTPPAGPASVDLVPTGSLRLFVIGETVQLTATPKDGSGNPVSAPVSWTSGNQAVATVSGSGLVTATGFGTTTIRATAGTVFKETSILVQAAVTEQSFNVNAVQSCSDPIMASARLEATSAHLLIYADVNNPPNGFTTADYEAFAASFESLVWPVLTENFGEPADIDNNARVIALFTRAVNELTEAGSTGVVGGFFFGRDLFPKTAGGGLPACSASNVAEMFYLLVPDPTGSINQNPRSVDDVRRITVGVIGHEMQHLINSSRRLFITQGALWPETIYMEEGLSHIAEELLFYDASGDAQPRMNLGANEIRATEPRRQAFNLFGISNAVRFRNYLRTPHNNSPYEKGDDLETRGAAWSFLRYLADRIGSTAVTESTCAAPVSLALGGRCRIDGAAAAQFDVAPGASLGEFTIVAFAADIPATGSGPTATDGTMTTTASATSSIAVTGPPNPSAAPAGARLSTFAAGSLGPGSGVQLDYTVHDRLRRLERRDLPSRVPAARAAYANRAHTGPRFYSAPATAPSMAVLVVEPIWAQLVKNSVDTGMVNLRNRFDPNITGAAKDWAVANYVDDIGLSGLLAQYTHPSWNFRTLLPEINDPNVYPLKVNSLTEATSLTMTNGGAAYYRLGVAAGTTSTVRFTVNNGVPTDRLRLVVVRTK
ncbi:MAG: Ig-like domain-containing protein [Gemmatimonadaceae bacterium]